MTLNHSQYPRGYFEAQVRFAKKWAEVAGEDIGQALLRRTALYRRLFDHKAPRDLVPQAWTDLLRGVHSQTAAEDITDRLYRAYTAKPNSIYVPPMQTSAFGYDYLADRQLVKIHFTNPQRGERPLSVGNLQIRRDEFRAMLQEIRVDHPGAKTLMSASWLRSTGSYRSFSPPDIAEQQNLMSPDMSFDGNSLWGQFIDHNGNINQRVYEQFIRAIKSGGTVGDLMTAFPYPVLKAEDPISKYYEYYGLGSE